MLLGQDKSREGFNVGEPGSSLHKWSIQEETPHDPGSSRSWVLHIHADQDWPWVETWSCLNVIDVDCTCGCYITEYYWSAFNLTHCWTVQNQEGTDASIRVVYVTAWRWITLFLVWFEPGFSLFAPELRNIQYCVSVMIVVILLTDSGRCNHWNILSSCWYLTDQQKRCWRKGQKREILHWHLYLTAQ